MTNLQPHPLSLIPPPLTPEEDEALGESIIKNGKIDDVVVYEGMILNGNHGYRHCIKHGVPFKTKEFIPNGVATAEDFVIAKLEGRHLNTGQRACVAAMVAKIKKKDPIACLSKIGRHSKIKKPRIHDNRTSCIVAKSLGVGSNSVMKAAVLMNNCKPLFQKVYLGEVALQSAYNEYRRNVGSSIKHYHKTSVNLSAFKTEIKIPNCFDARESVETFIKTMNAHGWILEVRFQDGKILAHWFGNGYASVGTNWGHVHHEFEFKRAVIVAANDKKNKL